MKTAFYFCTRNTYPKSTLAFKSLLQINQKLKFDIFYKSNNKEGLSVNYNSFLKEKSGQYDNIVFIHDDVYVDDFNILEKLQKAHDSFDIVGLAGGVNMRIQNPALWHLMCGGFQSNNLRGAVAHFTSENIIHMTSFGITPSRVAVLDGLFLSVNCKAINAAEFTFNENYTFHHYDISSCIDANKKKLKLGVYPIWVIHKSPGLLDPNSKLYLDSERKFLQEYLD